MALKVLHLSSHDYGGAGSAAVRLHEGMLTAGVDSRIAVLNRRSRTQGVIQVFGQHSISRLHLLFRKAFLKWRSDPSYGFQHQSLSLVPKPKMLLQLVGFRPDVIIAHSLSHFLSPHDLLALYLETEAPVILNLLDMGMLTGGCHYSWDCRRYEEACGKCPGLSSNLEDDISRQVWRNKVKSYGALSGTVIAPTSLLFEQARRSSIFRNWKTEKIFLGVDESTFKPIVRHEARLQLGLPPDAKIILFGAQSLTQKRKGMVYLVQALNHLLEQGCFSDGALIAVSAGNGKEFIKQISKSIPLYDLGFLNGDNSLSLAYSAADVFVCPSLEDSGPMMINESIMCGTPVVAFCTGVAPDLIINGETGYLVSHKDSRDLAYGIRTVLSADCSESSDMSSRCRAKALQLCRPQTQVSAYISICKQLLSEKLNR